MTDTSIDRRGLIGAAGGMIAGLGVPAFAATPGYDYDKAIASFKFNDPIWNREAYAKLQGNTDTSKTKYGWVHGICLGTKDGERVRELFGFEVASACRLQRNADNNYMKLLREVGYYTDLKTGQYLKEWMNPYNNETVKVVNITNDPFNYAIADTYPDPPSFGGLNTEKPPKRPFLLKWTIASKTTLMLETDIHLFYPNALDPEKWPRESAGKMLRASEMYRYVIRVEDMADPAKTSVEYTGTWNRITPWLPWMLNGQMQGHITYVTYMGGFDDMNSIPKKLLDHTKANDPKFLTAPETDQGPSLSSIENYARTQKPAPPKQPGS
ncbi:MAG: DUF1838 domain-containing protein [Alphaproteobacteria bacterium]|nr:DUF1838 domain-containing protein [Alphaproteobacteria bacterium]